ncbi:MAG: DUF3137 domain-containing protein [Candidatus Coprovivens sp.]
MFEHIPFFIFIIFVAVGASIIAVFIYGIKEATKDAKKREKIYSNLRVSKYTDIHKYIDILKNNKELEDKRKKLKNSKWWIILIILTAIAITIFLRIKVPIIIFISIVISIIIYNLSANGYTRIYKNQVISSILKNYNKDLTYQPDNGIGKDIYDLGNFESYDLYHTEDLITGQICGLQFTLADVHTQDVSTDSDGNTTYTTVFLGPVGVVELNKLKDLDIFITSNRAKIFRSNEYMELDNQLFEDKFDVFTNNDVLAMRILTPSFTNKILELHDSFGFFFEIKMVDGLVFFRFYSDTLFEPSPYNIEKEATDIAFYFNMLDGMKMIMDEIIKTLKDFER